MYTFERATNVNAPMQGKIVGDLGAHIAVATAPHPSQSGVGYVLAVAVNGGEYAVWAYGAGPDMAPVFFGGRRFHVVGGPWAASRAYDRAHEHFAQCTAAQERAGDLTPAQLATHWPAE